MSEDISNYFDDLKNSLLLEAQTEKRFLLPLFCERITSELIETGFIEGFEICNYKAPRGMQIDGFWFNDFGQLDLFIADFDFRDTLETIKKTEIEVYFRRVLNFFENSIKSNNFYLGFASTTPQYSLAREIYEKSDKITKLNLYLISERSISDRIQSFDDNEIGDILTSYHVWDISRLYRQECSRGAKEPIIIDFQEMYNQCVPCLPAHLSTDKYESYLLVMPGVVLSDLYGTYGSRLLEQNVRSFLQAKGKVNQGIRATIINEPNMFFAYNNGITATAQSVELALVDGTYHIKSILDLQIVNGGQTTASLFYASRKDKANLEQIFVQMKLSVVDSSESERVVSKISQYANTQNKVDTADLFSNHPYHIKLQDSSRRLWAPAQPGSQRETKWFYERARGQYVNELSKLTISDQKKFKADYPKTQLFNKTELAKYDNVWDDHPKWVNLGGQKNFVRFAERIGREWQENQGVYNDLYFKKVVARAIIFRATEKIITKQPWYSGGYRANIVAYTLAALNEVIKKQHKSLNYLNIWNSQNLDNKLINSIEISAAFVFPFITNPPRGISNVSEWAKKDDCWSVILHNLNKLELLLGDDFIPAVEEKTFKEIENSGHVHPEQSEEKSLVEEGLNIAETFINFKNKIFKKKS